MVSPAQQQQQQQAYDASLAMYLNNVALNGGTPSPPSDSFGQQQSPVSGSDSAAFQAMLFANAPRPVPGKCPPDRIQCDPTMIASTRIQAPSSTSPPRQADGPSELGTPAFSSHSASEPSHHDMSVSPQLSTDTSGAASTPQLAAQQDAGMGVRFASAPQLLPDGQYPQLDFDVSSLLNSFPSDETEQPNMPDPFAYTSLQHQQQQQQQHQQPHQQQHQQQQQQQQPAQSASRLQHCHPVPQQNPAPHCWTQPGAGATSESTLSQVPPLNAQGPFCYMPAFNPGVDPQGNAAGVVLSNLNVAQLLPYETSQHFPSAASEMPAPLDPSLSRPQALSISDNQAGSVNPAGFLQRGSPQDPPLTMPPFSANFGPSGRSWQESSVSRDTAPSYSTPVSDTFSSGVTRTTNRISDAARGPGPLIGPQGGSGTPIRRSRGRAATLDGTPKDLALKHRLSKQTLHENEASKRIKSDTSLAHKLTVHAKDMVKLEGQKDKAKWGILPPGVFDNLSSVMIQLHYRQQARLIRQANNPTLISPQTVAEEAAQKIQKRNRRRISDPDEAARNKVPHNAIERRYRNNINDRIATLRNAVPALRDLSPKNNGGSTPLNPRKPRKKGESEDLVDGVSAATKLNKATILGKATEYIHYLKKRELQLSSEVEGLKELIRSLHGGEDVLAAWLNEMDETRREQEAEEARLAALRPIKEEDKFDDPIDDFLLDSDDELDDSAPVSASVSSFGQSRPTGSYAMAVFLGFTLMGTSFGAHRSGAASHPGARAFSASHQLLNRSSPLNMSGAHHYDQVPTWTLWIEAVRFVAFATCAVVTLYPLYEALTKQSWRLSKTSDFRGPDGALHRRRAALDSALSKPAVNSVATDEAIRAFLKAPRSSVGALAGLVGDAYEIVMSRLRMLVAGPPDCTETAASVPTPSLAGPMAQAEADMWVRLLELETACGSYAQRSLLRKAHTVVKVDSICRALDEADDRGGLWVSEAGAEVADDYSPSGYSTTARVHALLALSWGRFASPTHAIGNMARNYARMQWARAQVQPRKSPWLSCLMLHTLEETLALLPPEGEASAAASRAEGDQESHLFLGSPVLLAVNTSSMAGLFAIWSTLFPHLIASASPTTFSARVRCERECALSASTLPESVHMSMSQLPSECAGASGGGVDVNAFLREFFARLHHGIVRVGLLTSSSFDMTVTRTALQALLDRLELQAVQTTPAFYLLQITLATWAFLRADATRAADLALPLLADIRAGTPMLGARAAAVACVDLILGPDAIPASTPFIESAPNCMADDRAVLSIAQAGLQWLSFLRHIGLNRAIFQGGPSESAAPADLLKRAFALRRTLARITSPALRAEVPRLESGSGAKLWCDAELGLNEAQESAIDVLGDLCGFLGKRAVQPQSSWGSCLRPLPSSSGGESELLWIPEVSAGAETE